MRLALGFALGLLAMLALGAWERRRALQCMLGLAVLAGPAAAQDRSGICAQEGGAGLCGASRRSLHRAEVECRTIAQCAADPSAIPDTEEVGCPLVQMDGASDHVVAARQVHRDTALKAGPYARSVVMDAVAIDRWQVVGEERHRKSDKCHTGASRAAEELSSVHSDSYRGSVIGYATDKLRRKGAPLSAQDRSGICAMNMGQLVREDSSHVRSGNSGWDACVWATADIGEPGGWWASLTVAPSRLFVWRVAAEAPVSRWSWRPGRGHRSIVFTWLWPEVGYTVRERPVTLDVAAGLVWPVQTSYEFGAPVGAAPSLMGSLSRSLGPWVLGVRAGIVYNRADRKSVV